MHEKQWDKKNITRQRGGRNMKRHKPAAKGKKRRGNGRTGDFM
jgi:hypothetical protein